jgi:hypothetical protein
VLRIVHGLEVGGVGGPPGAFTVIAELIKRDDVDAGLGCLLGEDVVMLACPGRPAAHKLGGVASERVPQSPCDARDGGEAGLVGKDLNVVAGPLEEDGRREPDGSAADDRHT